MRLVSVNVGLPRTVTWRGKTVRTAVWKAPVAGPVFAGRLNLVGDGQADLAGHGGEQRAVMVYQLDSYRYWEKQLGRTDLEPGCFGENFTVDGMSDAEVCIGDRFRIGGGVFEVSQPRVTCYRVGIRMDLPEMPALLVSHHRPGFYLRVIQEGEVSAGDAIEKIADGPERMSIAEIDALLYTAKHPVDALQRALRIPALSPGWQGSLKALLNAAEGGEPRGNAGLARVPAPLAWRGFRSLKVVGTSQESASIRSFELAAPDGSPLPDALPGQHLVLRLRPNAGAAPLTRIYSLCGPGHTGRYRFAVKKEGAASGFLHEHVRSGDLLDASAPRGDFTLAHGNTPVALLTAGVGVTPVLAMLHALAATDSESARSVWWIHSAQNKANHAFAHEARELIAALAHGRSCTIYSRPSAEDALGVDYDVAGHLAPALLEQLGVPTHADFYLCGPGRYLDELQNGLRTWGVESSRIHVEAFGPGATLTPGVVETDRAAPHPPLGPVGTGPLISFARSGLAARWDARFNNLLEFAEACSIPVRWSCRAGVCHTCESGLIHGEFRNSPEPIDPAADGNLLICCASPTTDLELDL